MASIWDTISSIFPLILFVAVCYGVKIFQGKVSQGIDGAKQQLQAKGVTYDKNGLSIKTDKRALQSDEYITQTSQAALNASKRVMNSHAVSFGAGSGSSFAGSGVDSKPADPIKRRGFFRSGSTDNKSDQ
ncbi:hypothetical protein [Phaffia rhodozyma]|uniref:Uncharacterized protein n=1 Tax=Phaffia rhodozyma TaxID=264483 RepID=A0A0F7SLX8_PHARH|nr:hypothetical protein [Phaffia rhodozyma]